MGAAHEPRRRRKRQDASRQASPCGPRGWQGASRAAFWPIDARRIDHVQISVRDLEVSAGFYAALFGIELKEEGEGATRWCILGAPDRFYVCLIEVPSDKGFDQAGIHINHVGLVVDDIDETVRRIHELGLRLEGNDATLDWPRSRSAYVVDPNGILIEITNRFGGGLG